MAATVTERKTSKASQERKFQDTSKLLRRERSKYLRHKFQQVVVQALLKKGDYSFAKGHLTCLSFLSSNPLL